MKNKEVVCADGFKMSVQASFNAYCSPRNDTGPYHEGEGGYPSWKDEMLMSYAENPEKPTETVYGYVPSTTVYLVITKHGGMVSGQVPLGIPVYENLKLEKK